MTAREGEMELRIKFYRICSLIMRSNKIACTTFAFIVFQNQLLVATQVLLNYLKKCWTVIIVIYEDGKNIFLLPLQQIGFVS